MADMEVRFGRRIGGMIVCIKPVFQYLFYFLMIAYECYDSVSDGMNVYQYSEGDSLDVSSRNESVYRVFFFSLIVSVICALSASVGYILLIVGLSKTIHDRETKKNDTTKLGKLIIFISIFFQVCFEESIQSVVLYYYIVRCSVLYSFWKISLFVCIALSLLLASFTFFKGAYLWFKKQDSLRRKYPSCLSACYDSKPSHVVCTVLCVFGTILSLALFALNITTLVDIIRFSEVKVPQIVVLDKDGILPPIQILPVKDLVKSNGNVVKNLPCSMQSAETHSSHFLGQQESFNCSSVIFALALVKGTKQVEYKLLYCFNENHVCHPIKKANITVKLTHDLCSQTSPVLIFLDDPAPSTKLKNNTNGG